ncbi:hypothetical protein MuYL_1688 [Mucilaginibacter xinganensis]|uniref:Uncharacterized protein n=1 Tax=Mucilaginibacter xinganensis TaxID=1234841 RepID=A0A223NV83_9SPHI|nr:hypothetical protein MuYL_1688 [Mucilaginibacter xinganensis]
MARKTAENKMEKNDKFETRGPDISTTHFQGTICNHLVLIKLHRNEMPVPADDNS